MRPSLASSANENNLAQPHYVTLILHLLVDPNGKLIHGELMDAPNTFRKRFMGGTGLLAAVQTWLTGQEQEHGQPRRG